MGDRQHQRSPQTKLPDKLGGVAGRPVLDDPPVLKAADDDAAKLHLALAPVYYQNYLYGELVASQLQATLRARAGGIVDRPAAGRILVDELFAPGLAVRWDSLVEQVTGEPLTPRHLAAELAST